MSEAHYVFGMLAKPVQSVLEELKLFKPTEPQVRAIPLVLRGENLLLIAATGSGKTEAVLLPVFSEILQHAKIEKIYVLYITPLRALNRDMIRRLEYWASKLNLSVQVRHGDTEKKIRRKQALSPPDILVTTPETLQAILPGSRMQQHLSHVRCIIIDEIHELAGEKRGAQLSLALERLLEFTGKEFQRIGLSATIEDPAKIGRFVAGTNRSISIVDISLPKNFSYAVEYPEPLDSDYDLAEKLKTAPEASARIRRIFELVRKHTSTLIFVNSRTNAEILGHKLGLLTDNISVHHGSLSKAERTRIEREFKANTLKAIVCTSTMELGIDIGQVDLVIQYLSPRQVSSLIQRVGRSGHRLHLVSKGIIITAFSEDVLESLAAAQRARRRQLEPVSVHENALDVLAHQIAGIVMDKRSVKVDEMLKIVKRAYPFRKLSKTKLLEVGKYLNILGLISLEGSTLGRTIRTRDYYYRNLSMIPDERRYPLIDVLSDRKIGTLGDEFMALRARIGLSIICKGKVWRILQIEDETGTVYVVPSEDPFAAVPGWDGEMLPIPYDLAKEVGKLRKDIAAELSRSIKAETAVERLSKKHNLDKKALIDPVKEIEEYLKENLPLPTHIHILLEAFGKYIVVHASFGEIVNRTLGSIFDAVLSNNDLITGWWNDGYRILIETPKDVDERTLKKISKLLFNLTSSEIENAFEEFVEARFPFSYKMKFVAERFGALPRGKTMDGDKMAQLPSRFKNTPIYEETMREAMIEKADISAAKRIMKDVRKGKIKISTLLRLSKPTALAWHIFSKYSEVAELMAPERVVLSNMDRMKKSMQSRTIRLLCLSCEECEEKSRIRDLKEKPSCGNCGSGLLARITYNQNPLRLRELLRRRKAGEELAQEELDEIVYARRTADLVLSYGKKAIIALQIKGVGPETAFRILGRMHPDEDEFYADLLKAKIQYLRTKPFWDVKERKRR
ncbi:MAG: DEAD/DEAH box helicase [Candidatus Bathyarchaeota archaeon]|nr:MAG: DEAD/DEAH box helicase [Candidatus Bathyarchaeota archaeon]